MSLRIKVLLLMMGLLCGSLSYAYPVEKKSHIETIVKNFVNNTIVKEAEDDKIEVQVQNLSAFSKLPACTTDIDAFIPNNVSRSHLTSVALACNGQRSWNVIVPVNVQVYTNILAAKRTLMMNDVISSNDLDYIFADKNALFSGYFKHKEDVEGSQVVRMITAGTVLTDKNIQKPLLVNKNQITDIVVRRTGITITMKGIAKSDGRLNETIKVYNPSSKRTIDAIVIGTNKAEAV